MKNSRGNALVIVVLVIVSVLIAGYLLVTQFILPKVLNTAVNTAIDASSNSLSFDNAQSFPITQDLSKNEGMILQLSINKGKVSINSNPEGDVLTGNIKYLGAKPIYTYQTDKDKRALFNIKSADESGDSLELHLSKETNGRIDLALGAGSVDIDLTDLDIPILNISAGAGTVNVTFSKNHSTQADIGAGVSKLNFNVYKGSGIKIKLYNPVNLQLGDSYEKVSDGYQTKGYKDAKVKVELNLGQGLGNFNIKEI